MGSFSAYIIAIVAALGGAGAKRQDNYQGPVKLQIHHADPWAVKLMLEGGSPGAPELSTIWGVQGGAGRGNGNQQNGGGSPLLSDGFLVVNPTDNSLWWYPKKSK